MPSPTDPTKFQLYIERQRQSHLGKTAWNKGLTKKDNPKISGGRPKGVTSHRVGVTLEEEYGIEASKHIKQKQRLAKLGIKQKPEHIRNALKPKGKSNLETAYEKKFNELNIPLMFVGDGKFSVGRKVPDFVNFYKKLAVEVYYRKHKEQFRGGVEMWKKDRTTYFNEQGWNIEYLDETMLNKNDMINVRIGD